MNYKLRIMNGGTCYPFLKSGLPSSIHHSSFLVPRSRRGFTLIEMLVVIGIIAVLVGATMASFSKMGKTADKTKAQELVSQAATALAAIYEADGMWPKSIRDASSQGDETKGVLGNKDYKVARILASRGYMPMSLKNGELVGRDRYGVLTPWAAKKLENSQSLDDDYVRANVLRFAVDLNGDGVITAQECGNRTGAEEIRATAVVWCSSKDGKSVVQSWTKGQATKVQ